MKQTFETIALCMALTLPGAAATIEFKAVPTGVNDGMYYVTPYEVTVDGVAQMVTCYDVYDDVDFGDVWQANILTLAQVAASGFFADQPNALDGYERIGWLNSQTYSNASEQVGLQHAIWSVFGTASSTPESLSYEAAADVAAASGYAGAALDSVRFIEQVGGVRGQNGTKQAFVFNLPAGTAQVTSVPEPAAIATGGSLLLLAAIFKAAKGRRRRVPGPN